MCVKNEFILMKPVFFFTLSGINTGTFVSVKPVKVLSYIIRSRIQHFVNYSYCVPYDVCNIVYNLKYKSLPEKNVMILSMYQLATAF